MVFDVDHDFEGPRAPKAHLDTAKEKLGSEKTPPVYKNYPILQQAQNSRGESHLVIYSLVRWPRLTTPNSPHAPCTRATAKSPPTGTTKTRAPRGHTHTRAHIHHMLRHTQTSRVKPLVSLRDEDVCERADLVQLLAHGVEELEPAHLLRVELGVGSGSGLGYRCRHCHS